MKPPRDEIPVRRMPRGINAPRDEFPWDEYPWDEYPWNETSWEESPKDETPWG